VNRTRAAVAALGVVFGFLLSWGGLSDPDAIRRMLLLEDGYLYVMMAGSVAVSFVGVRLLRRAHARALLTGEPVSWTTNSPERRHVTGSILFGLGWAVSDACPGPIATQLGQGVTWSLFTFAGVVAGVLIFLRRQEAASPASAATPGDAPAPRPATAQAALLTVSAPE
jgi:uncharacterized membrane protein YedE/YeeE